MTFVSPKTPPKIMCARCGRYVDRCMVMRSESYASFVFKVWCHGEVDLCYLPDDCLRDLDWSIVEATAFTRAAKTLQGGDARP